MRASRPPRRPELTVSSRGWRLRPAIG
jgi:hypothetical protein